MKMVDVAGVEELRQQAEKLAEMVREAQRCIDWIQSKIDSCCMINSDYNEKAEAHADLSEMLSYKSKLLIVIQGVRMNYAWITGCLPFKIEGLEVGDIGGSESSSQSIST